MKRIKMKLTINLEYLTPDEETEILEHLLSNNLHGLADHAAGNGLLSGEVEDAEVSKWSSAVTQLGTENA
jgi:hypothetical protein